VQNIKNTCGSRRVHSSKFSTCHPVSSNTFAMWRGVSITLYQARRQMLMLDRKAKKKKESRRRREERADRSQPLHPGSVADSPGAVRPPVLCARSTAASGSPPSAHAH
jgi:hypothetical protein